MMERVDKRVHVSVDWPALFPHPPPNRISATQPPHCECLSVNATPVICFHSVPCSRPADVKPPPGCRTNNYSISDKITSCHCPECQTMAQAFTFRIPLFLKYAILPIILKSSIVRVRAFSFGRPRLRSGRAHYSQSTVAGHRMRTQWPFHFQS